MNKEYYIKNMVCDRCKMVISNLLKNHHATIVSIQLGKVNVTIPTDFDELTWKKALEENGFQLMENPEVKLVEETKVCLLSLLEAQEKNNPEKLSVFLSKKLNKSYSTLSKNFKTYEGKTIENYYISLKIEKAKELIQMNRLSFSEIAYQLGYNAISHLSGQFKSLTGITMSAYKTSQQWNRKALDKIL